MNKLTPKLLFSALLLTFTASAQTTADFENISVPPAGFLNDAGQGGYFFSGHTALPNYYDVNFDYWEGWAISNVTDTITPGFSNQYSAIAGGGADQTKNYAVAYAFNPTSIFLNGPAKGGTLSGIYITNDAYTYYSMRDGDAFSKKFGGETGADPDFLKLTIHGYNNGIENPDSIVFYLADYRFSNNSQDYIIAEWTYIDLKPLGNAEEITFGLTSTDNGTFGMNTPAYFCADQLVTDDNTTGVNQPSASVTMRLSPNPAHGFTQLEWNGHNNTIGRIYGSTGKLQQNITVEPGINTIDLQALPAGIYFLQAEGKTVRFTIYE